MLNVSVQGVTKSISRLQKLNLLGTALINEKIHNQGFKVEAEVKKSIAGHRAEPTSVDTGRFLNSVRVDSSEKLQTNVKSSVGYAKFLEYGTSRMSPRSHFRNTAKRNEAKVREFVNKEIKKISN